MSSPYCDWPFDSQIPQHYPPLRVASNEAAIGSYKTSRVDLRSVSTQDICWLRDSHGQLARSCSQEPLVASKEVWVEVDNRFFRRVPLNPGF